MLCSVDVRAADGLLIADSDGDGVITLDEINDVGALLNYGLTTGYYVTMPDTTAAIEGTDAYTEFMAALDEEAAAALVMGYIEEDSNGKFVFTAADAFCDLVNSIFGEVTSSAVSGYTFYPALAYTPAEYAALWQADSGATATAAILEGFNKIEVGSPVITFNDTFDRITFYSPNISSLNYGGTYHTYSVDQMYYYLAGKILHAVAYDYSTGDFVECTLESKNLNFYLTDSGYFSHSYASWNNTRGIGTLAFGAGGTFRGLHGKSCLVFNSLTDIYSYYGLEKNVYVGSESPQTVTELLVDTLNNTDWTSLSNQLWNTFESEVDSAQALGAMPQSQFQEILDNNITELVDSLTPSDEGEDVPEDEDSDASDIDDLFVEVQTSNSWLGKIYALLESFFAWMVENDPEVESPSDSSVVEKLEEQREVLENNAQQQLEQSATQHEEEMEQSASQHEETKGFFSSVSDFFGSFFDNLIDSIVGIFVPSDERMSELFDELELFFENTFGFLYYPFDLLTDVFEIFTTADSPTVMKFPSFSIMGEKVWDDVEYDIASEPVVVEIFGYVRIGTGTLLAFWFVNYLRVYFDKRFGGGGN